MAEKKSAAIPWLQQQESAEPETPKTSSFGDIFDNIGAWGRAAYADTMAIPMGRQIKDVYDKIENGQYSSKEEYDSLVADLDRLQNERNEYRDAFNENQKILNQNDSYLKDFTEIGGTVQGIGRQARDTLIGAGLGAIGGSVVPVAGTASGAMTGARIGNFIGSIDQAAQDADTNAIDAWEKVLQEGGTSEQAEQAYKDAFWANMPTEAMDIISSMYMGGKLLGGTGKILNRALGGKLAGTLASGVNKVARFDLPAKLGTYVANKSGQAWLGQGVGVGLGMLGNAVEEGVQEPWQDYETERAIDKQRRIYDPTNQLNKDVRDHSIFGDGGLLDYYTTPEGMNTAIKAAKMGAAFGGVGGLMSKSQYTELGTAHSDSIQSGKREADWIDKQGLLKDAGNLERYNNVKETMANVYDLSEDEKADLSVEDVARMYHEYYTNLFGQGGNRQEQNAVSQADFLNEITGEETARRGLMGDTATKYIDEFGIRPDNETLVGINDNQQVLSEEQVQETLEQDGQETTEEGTENKKGIDAKASKPNFFDNKTSKQAKEEQAQNGGQVQQKKGGLKEKYGNWERIDEGEGYDYNYRASYRNTKTGRVARIDTVNGGYTITDITDKEEGTPTIAKTLKDVTKFLGKKANQKTRFMSDGTQEQEQVSQALPQEDGVIATKDITEDENGEQWFNGKKIQSNKAQTIHSMQDLHDYYKTHKDLMSKDLYAEISRQMMRFGIGNANNTEIVLDLTNREAGGFGSETTIRTDPNDENSAVAKAIVRLYAGADLATAAHEMAHLGWMNLSDQDRATFTKWAEKTQGEFVAKILGMDYDQNFRSYLIEALTNRESQTSQDLWAKIKREGAVQQTLGILNGQNYGLAVEERFAWEFSNWYAQGYIKGAKPRNIIERILNKACATLQGALNLLSDTNRYLNGENGYNGGDINNIFTNMSTRGIGQQRQTVAPQEQVETVTRMDYAPEMGYDLAQGLPNVADSELGMTLDEEPEQNLSGNYGTTRVNQKAGRTAQEKTKTGYGEGVANNNETLEQYRERMKKEAEQKKEEKKQNYTPTPKYKPKERNRKIGGYEQTSPQGETLEQYRKREAEEAEKYKVPTSLKGVRKLLTIVKNRKEGWQRALQSLKQIDPRKFRSIKTQIGNDLWGVSEDYVNDGNDLWGQPKQQSLFGEEFEETKSEPKTQVEETTEETKKTNTVEEPSLFDNQTEQVSEETEQGDKNTNKSVENSNLTSDNQNATMTENQSKQEVAESGETENTRGTENLQGNVGEVQRGRGVRTGDDSRTGEGRVGQDSVEERSEGNGKDISLLKNSKFKSVYNARKQKKTEVKDWRDLSDSDETKQVFVDALNASKEADMQHGVYVDGKTVEELKDCKVILHKNKMAGFAITPDGNIVGVFSNPKNPIRGILNDMIFIAHMMGGNRMDCFGNFLLRGYRACGFTPVARTTFAEEYYPADNPANNTIRKEKPDVFFLVKDNDNNTAYLDKMNKGEYKNDQIEIDDIPLIDSEDSYGDALGFQGQVLEGIQKKENKNKSTKEVADSLRPKEESTQTESTEQNAETPQNVKQESQTETNQTEETIEQKINREKEYYDNKEFEYGGQKYKYDPEHYEFYRIEDGKMVKIDEESVEGFVLDGMRRMDSPFYKEENKTLESVVEHLESEIFGAENTLRNTTKKELKNDTQLSAWTKEKNELQTKIKDAQKTINSLKGSYDTGSLESTMKEMERELKNVEEEIAEYLKDIKEWRDWKQEVKRNAPKAIKILKAMYGNKTTNKSQTETPVQNSQVEQPVATKSEPVETETTTKTMGEEQFKNILSGLLTAFDKNPESVRNTSVQKIVDGLQAGGEKLSQEQINTIEKELTTRQNRVEEEAKAFEKEKEDAKNIVRKTMLDKYREFLKDIKGDLKAFHKKWHVMPSEESAKKYSEDNLKTFMWFCNEIYSGNTMEGWAKQGIDKNTLFRLKNDKFISQINPNTNSKNKNFFYVSQQNAKQMYKDFIAPEMTKETPTEQVQQTSTETESKEKTTPKKEETLTAEQIIDKANSDKTFRENSAVYVREREDGTVYGQVWTRDENGENLRQIGEITSYDDFERADLEDEEYLAYGEDYSDDIVDGEGIAEAMFEDAGNNEAATAKQVLEKQIEKETNKDKKAFYRHVIKKIGSYISDRGHISDDESEGIKSLFDNKEDIDIYNDEEGFIKEVDSVYKKYAKIKQEEKNAKKRAKERDKLLDKWQEQTREREYDEIDKGINEVAEDIKKNIDSYADDFYQAFRNYLDSDYDSNVVIGNGDIQEKKNGKWTHVRDLTKSERDLVKRIDDLSDRAQGYDDLLDKFATIVPKKEQTSPETETKTKKTTQTETATEAKPQTKQTTIDKSDKNYQKAIDMVMKYRGLSPVGLRFNLKEEEGIDIGSIKAEQYLAQMEEDGLVKGDGEGSLRTPINNPSTKMQEAGQNAENQTLLTPQVEEELENLFWKLIRKKQFHGMDSRWESGKLDYYRSLSNRRQGKEFNPEFVKGDKAFLNAIKNVNDYIHEKFPQYKNVYRGVDGHWRFEFSDKDANFINGFEKLSGKTLDTTLDKILKHDNLYKFYSKLKGMPVHLVRNTKMQEIMEDTEHNYYAMYDPDEKAIYINSDMFESNDEVRNSLLHEIQHAIQDIEGFANGTNDNAYNNDYDFSEGEKQAVLTEKRSNMSDEELQQTPRSKTLNPNEKTIIQEQRPVQKVAKSPSTKMQSNGQNNLGYIDKQKDIYSVTFTKSAQKNGENQKKIDFYRKNKSYWRENKDAQTGSITFTRALPYQQHQKTIIYDEINGKKVGKRKKAKWREYYEAFKDHVIKWLFNDKHFLEKAARNVGAIEAYMRMMVMKDQGAVAGAAIEDGIVKHNGKNGERTKSLNSIIEAVGEENQKDFLNYCEAYRVLDLEKRNIYQKMTPKDARDEIAKVKRSKNAKLFEQQRQNFVEYNHELLWVLVDGGFITEQQYNKFIENDPNFIPLAKNMDELEGYVDGFRDSKTMINVAHPMHKIGTSMREVANPFLEMQKRTVEYYVKASRNKAGHIFVHDIAEAIAQNAKGDVVAQNQGMVRKLASRDKNGNPISHDNKQYVFYVWENGEKQYYQVADREIYIALKSFDAEQMGALSKIMNATAGKASRLVRNTATMTPDFGLRNLVRDNMEAFISSEHGFLPLVDSLWGMYQMANDTQWFKEYQRMNGEHLSLNRDGEDVATVEHDIKDNVKFYKTIVPLFKKDLHEFMDKDRSKPARAKSLLKLVALDIVPLQSIYKANKRLNDYLETGTRIGEYRNARMGYKGLKGRLFETSGSTIWTTDMDLSRAKNTEMIAAYKSKDITLNFGQHGVLGKELNRYIPFFNASLQGIYKLGNTLDDMIHAEDARRRQELMFKCALMGAMGMAAALAGQGDDDYDEAPDYEHENFWILPNGIRIPKDQLFGKLIGGTVEKATAQYLKDGDVKKLELVQDILGNFAIDKCVPALVDLGWGTIGNYDSFKKKSVTPEYMADKLGYLQKDLSTSKAGADISETIYKVTDGLFKALGYNSGGIDIGAKKVDFVISKTLSNLGKYATSLWELTGGNEKMTRGAEVEDKGGFAETSKELPYPLNQIVGTFATNRNSFQSISDFYERHRELKKLSSDESIMSKNEKKAWEAYQAAYKKDKQYRDALKAIKLDKSLTGAQKRQKADKIFKQQISVARKLHDWEKKHGLV